MGRRGSAPLVRNVRRLPSLLTRVVRLEMPYPVLVVRLVGIAEPAEVLAAEGIWGEMTINDGDAMTWITVDWGTSSGT